MNDPKNDAVREKAQDLLRRLNYSSDPPKSDADSRTPPPAEKKASAFLEAVFELFKEAGMPPPLPAAAKLMSAVKKPNAMADALFSGMKAAPKTNVMSSLAKVGQDKVALNKLLGELVKTQKDPARLANISRLATSRGAQLAGEGASSAKKYLAVGTAAAQRMAKAAGAGSVLKSLASEAGTHKAELAGLGILAAPAVDQLQAHGRAAIAGDYGKAGVKKREVLPHVAHPLMEAAGLGVLAAPSIAHLRGH